MRIIVKRALFLVLAVAAILYAAMPCFAAAERGSITVLLEDKEKNKINGTTVHLCQIAGLNSTGYYPTAPFENSGISISGILNTPDAATAKTVANYVKEQSIKTLSAISDNGKISFSDLDLGIWLVYCDDSSKYTFNPYIVLLPYESEGKLFYEITSAPKIEDSKPDTWSIYVLKKWEDKNNAPKKRPLSVTVELLSGNSVVASAELSEANGWAHVFADLPKDGEYSVREKQVEDYTASYSGDAVNGFVVTNTYAGEKLPQTGQYWWPVVIIAVVGACFVLLGILEFGAKKNGKK